ncbi:hypothetical protein KO504_09110 [Winogradskyella psychrotolerans]|uniref:hypothetical protein n=1 Tax=Winogradskyella psychrotolerans TaxID=1344585 RepID=UPI001C071491|nr:hypothetical protein [Winogradskyella psychrotolerans]MBU2921498.1 hypothetical protein [Winogradskyella psychrotolerans]
MITQDLLNNKEGISLLQPEDLDTTNFILSLYGADDINISEAITYLKNYISIKSPIEELALKHIAHNFQYYKQAEDTIIYDLGFDNVYCALLEHSVLGFYAILKEFITPSAEDWELKQIRTYSPLTNSCFEKDCWVSKKRSISLEWETASRMLADIICSKFDQNISSINKRLYEKLDKKSLAHFFDIEEFEASSGYEDYRDLKRILFL